MKKLIGILTLVLIFSLTANAQQRQGQKKGNQSQYTPEQIAELQSKKLQVQLDLNDSQKYKIYKIFKKQAEEREVARTEMQKRRSTGKRPTDAERFDFQQKRLDRQIANKATMKKILTNEQFEKWEKFQALRMNQRNKSGAKSTKNGARKNNSPRNNKRS